MLRKRSATEYQKEKATLPVLLSASWQRCTGYHLERDSAPSVCVEHDQLRDLRSHNGWSDILKQQFPESGSDFFSKSLVLVIADASGVILDTCGNRKFLNKAEGFFLSPGHIWTEQHYGTNAIGTALAVQQACEVRGSEHWLNRNSGLCCSAYPLFSPEGYLAGILDLSSPADLPFRDAPVIIRRFIQQTEYLWTTKRFNAERYLLHLRRENNADISDSSEFLLVIEGDVIVGANRLAVNEFGLLPPYDSVTLDTLFTGGNRQSDFLESCSGQRYLQRRTRPHRAAVNLSPRLRFPSRREADNEKKEKAQQLINHGISVCITGETGTGKEYLARELHRNSCRKNGNFVAINCAALPEHLTESELFGYAPGAFTGANSRGYPGKIREASGGILFLDEIGDMPATLQTRLLRVLQDKKVIPLGSNTPVDVDFVLISATHRDLDKMCAEGTFRDDLLYRIREFHLHLQPLRERSDLGKLIVKLWEESEQEMKKTVMLGSEIIEDLKRHSWPGNVRQLLNVLRVLMALARPGGRITPGDLSVVSEDICHIHNTVKIVTERKIVDEAGGNISRAAKMLGISRSTLYRRLKSL
ncbi:TPA: sigma-54-dependent Fis family transcriptional regulator [Escherichia coli]